MPITNNNGTISVTGEDGLAFFALLQLRGRLSLEQSGLKSRGGSTVLIVNRHFGTEFKNGAKGRREALAFIEARITEAKENR